MVVRVLIVAATLLIVLYARRNNLGEPGTVRREPKTSAKAPGLDVAAG
jgi:hypothetical protein